jgi:hypothetical protein
MLNSFIGHKALVNNGIEVSTLDQISTTIPGGRSFSMERGWGVTYDNGGGINSTLSQIAHAESTRQGELPISINYDYKDGIELEIAKLTKTINASPPIKIIEENYLYNDQKFLCEYNQIYKYTSTRFDQSSAPLTTGGVTTDYEWDSSTASPSTRLQLQKSYRSSSSGPESVQSACGELPDVQHPCGFDIILKG